MESKRTRPTHIIRPASQPIQMKHKKVHTPVVPANTPVILPVYVEESTPKHLKVVENEDLAIP